MLRLRPAGISRLVEVLNSGATDTKNLLLGYNNENTCREDLFHRGELCVL
jgi:hypothetical protein